MHSWEVLYAISSGENIDETNDKKWDHLRQRPYNAFLFDAKIQFKSTEPFIYLSARLFADGKW